jgi:hypothetical protein
MTLRGKMLSIISANTGLRYVESRYVLFPGISIGILSAWNQENRSSYLLEKFPPKALQDTGDVLSVSIHRPLQTAMEYSPSVAGQAP